MRVPARTKSLTVRLVATSVALVALVSVLVVLATSLVMDQYLTSRLDQQVHASMDRAINPDGHRPGGPEPADGDERDGDDGAFGHGPQSPDTMVAVLSTSPPVGGVLGNNYDEIQALSTRAVRQLDDLPVDGKARTVSLDELGDYRVVVTRDSQDRVLATGLPMAEIHDTTESLLLRSSLLASSGIVLAGLLGVLLVRRQLRPLHEVAATAYDVTAMPLDASGQTIDTRVHERYTDPDTEVGQVGSALNTLLDHVDSALDARHRSEQQVRQFVADASHELRTPLSTIHGYAELSRRTPDDAEMLSQAMGKVETEASGEEGGGFFDAVGEEQHGPTVIAIAGVVETDADLEDALIEAADRAGFRVPLVLDRFVRLVILAGVEERDPFLHARRRQHWFA